jgi:hypothetical protein
MDICNQVSTLRRLLPGYKHCMIVGVIKNNCRMLSWAKYWMMEWKEI